MMLTLSSATSFQGDIVRALSLAPTTIMYKAGLLPYRQLFLQVTILDDVNVHFIFRSSILWLRGEISSRRVHQLACGELN
jgi:hypothetical protein